MRKRDKLLHGILYSMAVALFAYVGCGFYFLFMPMSHWVEYHDVYPIEDTVQVRETILFTSHVSRHRKTDLFYNDIMFCKKEGALVYTKFSHMSTQHLAAAPMKNLKVVWPYNPGVPHTGECYLESNIRLELPMGHMKSVSINGLKRGHIFTVVDNS
jgi:hypothetical protein